MSAAFWGDRPMQGAPLSHHNRQRQTGPAVGKEGDMPSAATAAGTATATTPEPLRVHIKPASAPRTREPAGPTGAAPAAGSSRPRPAASMGRALVLGVEAEYASVMSEVLARSFETRMTTLTDVALGLIASQRYDA